MKIKLSKGLLLLYFMSLIIACNTKKTEPVNVVVDKEQIKKEIQAKENEYAEVYNAGELKKIGYYADDAISFSQNQAPKVGREAIIELFESRC